MKKYAYLFEAKSVQSFILDSGRMRELIGASELVDSLTTSLLPDALQALGYEEEYPIGFSRHAGGAIYAFAADKKALDRFAALWSLLVQHYAPGMAYDIGRGEGDSEQAAFEKARDDLRDDNSRVRPVLPVTAPITRRSARTGNPGVAMDDGLTLDRPSKRKELFAKKHNRGLIERFSPARSDQQEGLTCDDWPRDLTPGKEGAFPFLGEDHRLALIHADGNGMGELLRKAGTKAKTTPVEYVEIFRGLSDAITTATQNAARYATEIVLIPERNARERNFEGDKRLPLAARPIVLGGDDLTVLVRADLALPYLCAFLDRFEAESTELLPKLKIGANGLTAGAGVVYMRASQPFYLATHLAESLMDLAKKAAKGIDPNNPPSTLAFHRVTNSMIEDYDKIVAREKTNSLNGVDFVNTLGAYALHKDGTLPAIADLRDLQCLLQDEAMSRGPTRQLHTLIGLAPSQAKTAYKRWRGLMGEEKNKKASLLKRFDEKLGGLTRNGMGLHEELPFARYGERYRSPLGDALTLMAVNSEPPVGATEVRAKEETA